MTTRKTVAQHAAAVLREGGHTGVMWGDVTLIHEIAERAGMRHQGPATVQRVLDRLEGSPLFRKTRVSLGPAGRGRWVRSFELAEPTTYVLWGTQGQGGDELDRFDSIAALRDAYNAVRGDMSLAIQILPGDIWIEGDKHDAFLAG